MTRRVQHVVICRSSSGTAPTPTQTEDPDEYKAENVFWVPAEARWSHLQANAKLPTIGKIVDDAMVAIERDNPRLKGVLPKDYARPGLDKQRLGELIDVIATIELTAASEGEKPTAPRCSPRVLVFPTVRQRRGQERRTVYTPSAWCAAWRDARPLQAASTTPLRLRRMFGQSEKFVESTAAAGRHQSTARSNATTRRLAVMTRAARHRGRFRPRARDTFPAT